MPLPDDLKVIEGQQIVFADFAGTFAPTAANDIREGTPLQSNINPGTLANGSYYQGEKVDFGASRASMYSAMCAIKFNNTGLVPGNLVEFWLAPSPRSAPATGDPGGITGTKGAYTGPPGSNAADGVKQLLKIGAAVVHGVSGTGADIQVMQILDTLRDEQAWFRPPQRYGTLVLFNGSGAAMASNNNDEFHVVFNPIEQRVVD